MPQSRSLLGRGFQVTVWQGQQRQDSGVQRRAPDGAPPVPRTHGCICQALSTLGSWEEPALDLLGCRQVHALHTSAPCPAHLSAPTSLPPPVLPTCPTPPVCPPVLPHLSAHLSAPTSLPHLSCPTCPAHLSCPHPPAPLSTVFRGELTCLGCTHLSLPQLSGLDPTGSLCPVHPALLHILGTSAR